MLPMIVIIFLSDMTSEGWPCGSAVEECSSTLDTNKDFQDRSFQEYLIKAALTLKNLYLPPPPYFWSLRYYQTRNLLL